MVHDVDDLQKCLVQTWFDFDQNTTDSTTDHALT